MNILNRLSVDSGLTIERIKALLIGKFKTVDELNRAFRDNRDLRAAFQMNASIGNAPTFSPSTYMKFTPEEMDVVELAKFVAEMTVHNQKAFIYCVGAYSLRDILVGE